MFTAIKFSKEVSGGKKAECSTLWSDWEP